MLAKKKEETPKKFTLPNEIIDCQIGGISYNFIVFKQFVITS
jgi:hypothetical protein